VYWLSEVIKQRGMPCGPGRDSQAACLAKTDLTTELVKEFTELQGIVAGYMRARRNSIPHLRSDAARNRRYDLRPPNLSRQRYVPGRLSAVLSIATGRHDAGCSRWGWCERAKDPFALRRQATAS